MQTWLHGATCSFMHAFLCEMLKIYCAPKFRRVETAHACRWPATKKAIEDSLGWRIDDLVEWIDEVPVASGSIGQVHRAQLSEKAANLCGMPLGTIVAIKVKHPGVSKSIQRDFSIMMWIAQQVEWIPTFKKLHLSESLAQFAAPLREQVRDSVLTADAVPHARCLRETLAGTTGTVLVANRVD